MPTIDPAIAKRLERYRAAEMVLLFLSPGTDEQLKASAEFRDAGRDLKYHAAEDIDALLADREELIAEIQRLREPHAATRTPTGRTPGAAYPLQRLELRRLRTEVERLKRTLAVLRDSPHPNPGWRR